MQRLVKSLIRGIVLHIDDMGPLEVPFRGYKIDLQLAGWFQLLSQRSTSSKLNTAHLLQDALHRFIGPRQ